VSSCSHPVSTNHLFASDGRGKKGKKEKKEKKRKEKKRKGGGGGTRLEKTRPFGINPVRSPVINQAAQGQQLYMLPI